MACYYYFGEAMKKILDHQVHPFALRSQHREFPGEMNIICQDH